MLRPARGLFFSNHRFFFSSHVPEGHVLPLIECEAPGGGSASLTASVCHQHGVRGRGTRTGGAAACSTEPSGAGRSRDRASPAVRRDGGGRRLWLRRSAGEHEVARSCGRSLRWSGSAAAANCPRRAKIQTTKRLHAHAQAAYSRPPLLPAPAPLPPHAPDEPLTADGTELWSAP